MAVNREQILEVLSGITDPDLKQDIVTANLVEHADISDGKVLL